MAVAAVYCCLLLTPLSDIYYLKFDGLCQIVGKRVCVSLRCFGARARAVVGLVVAVVAVEDWYRGGRA